MMAYHEAQHIKRLTIHIKGLDEKRDINEELKQITLLITKLSGSMRDEMTTFPWTFDTGTLSKLKSYCHLFSQCAPEHLQARMVHDNVNKAWLNCLHGLDLLRNLQIIDSAAPKNLSSLLRILDKIHRQLYLTSRLLAEGVYHFRDDENVLFFLLRNYKRVVELYGSKFLGKTINKMYPQGLQDLESLIMHRYKNRGFEHLLPAISQKMTEIQQL